MEIWVCESTGRCEPKLFSTWDKAFAQFEYDLREDWEDFLVNNEEDYGLWVDGSPEEKKISVDDGPRVYSVTLDE